MSYYESAEGEVITKERALKELEKHGGLEDVDDFYECLGDQPYYDAQEVLGWLGLVRILVSNFPRAGR